MRSKVLTTAGINSLADKFSIRQDLDQSDRPIYIGYTIPGQGNKGSEAIWAICKLAYTGANTNYDSLLWADGNVFFDNIWNSRTTLTYR